MEIKKFKDGQINVSLDLRASAEYTMRGTSYEDLFAAASYVETVKNTFPYKFCVLKIMCLIGQRSDRRFNQYESFDLKVITNFINSMRYSRVEILHPHSDVTTALINNSVVVDHQTYIEDALLKIDDKNAVLVSPDAGAYKATYQIAENIERELVASNKFRKDGVPFIQVQGDVTGKACLIVDDIADGGRTFIALAKRLREEGATKVYLYVTHGMFHYGFDEIDEYIDHVYCTNSYRNIEHESVTQFKVIT